MKQFLSFLHKEFTHIFRDSRTMLILLVMPVLLICLFGFAVTTEVKNSRVAVVDQMNNQLSRKLINEIDANAYFSVVCIKEDNNRLPDMLQSGEADAIVILNEELGIQILADGSEPNQAQTRVGYLQGIINANLNHNLNGSTPITVTTRMLFNPQLKSEYNFVPGVIGMIVMLICAMMTSISIVREKENGTMEILLASPLPPLTIILAKLIPYFIISSVNLITILLLSYYILGVPIAGSIVAFFIISMLYVAVALSLGLLISSAVSTQLAAMLLSLLLIVPTMYLSGMAFPLESMPTALYNVSTIVPTRWFNDAARKILIQGVEFKYVVKHCMILSLMAIVLIAISFKLFKIRLE